MGVSPGTRLGPYEIIAQIGAGGMGEVYRAKDTRLDRIVAIKILPAHLSDNPELKQRFDREARAISSLSHPHICALHDLGTYDGIDFLVMEFLEGETLAQRLQKGALSVDQTLRYGIQIAEALDQAHKRGIVHRDLKPANIMLTKSGVKLLDFGLAKLQQPVAQQLNTGISTRPTEQGDLTVQGAILGTLQYMSPEQLEGRDTDSRTDIFALGMVLYEMITGKHAFIGKSQASVIAAILSSDPPPISALQPATPASLDRLVKTCMAKDPEERWQTVHDVTLELKWISENASEHSIPSTKRKVPFLERAIWAAALLILAGLFLYFYDHRAGDASVIRFMVPPPSGASFDNTIALSPNGQMLVFVANDSAGNNILWLRKLDSSHPVNLRDTEGASFPFWSPDNQSIGFFTQGKLKRVDLAANKTQTICNANNPKGGTWNREGVILFAENEGGAIYRVSSKGGNPELETSFDQSRGEATIRYPFFLPDDRHYLCFIWSADPAKKGIYVSTLDTREREFITPADSGAIYTPGYLIYLYSGNHLMAHAFDLKNFKTSGDPTPVDEKIWVKWFTSGFTAIAASQNGILAYRTGGYQTGEFIWYDRTGKQLGIAGPSGLYAEPALSPDEKKMVFAGIGTTDNSDSDLWILELTRGITNRFTSKKSIGDITPVWSPDGNSIVYASYPEGAFYEKSLLNGKETLLLKLSGFATTDDWSRDGRFISYSTLNLKTNQSDIWILPKNPGGKPFAFVSSEYNESSSQISPDSKWIAYVSDESGRYEVYVQSFPGPGPSVQISTAGGEQPTWRGDSKEIFYIAPDNKVMSVDFLAGSSEQPPAKVLFQSRIMTRVEARNHYVVTSDGQRFLINTPSEEIAKSPIEVILNWTRLLK